MKALLITLVLPLILSAQTQLEGIMKQMGANFKEVSRNVSQHGITDFTVELAQEMGVLLGQARDIMPESVAELSEPERSKAFIKYQDLISRLQEENRQLVEALIVRDSPRATKVIQRMMEIRKEGHDQFKS